MQILTNVQEEVTHVMRPPTVQTTKVPTSARVSWDLLEMDSRVQVKHKLFTCVYARSRLRQSRVQEKYFTCLYYSANVYTLAILRYEK